MNKINKISILTVMGLLSLGLVSNSIYCAAARTPYAKTKRAPQDIARDYLMALQNNDDRAATDLMQEGVNGQLALHVAIMEGHTDAMWTIIRTEQADINALLSEAIKNKDIGCVRAIAT